MDKKRFEKHLAYWIVALGFCVIYITFIPFLMDYYIVRPDVSFFEFYLFNVLDKFYEFEGIVIGLLIAVFYCLTLNIGASTVVVSCLMFILTHASYVKYINRREMLRLADLKLTEVAGTALNALYFRLDRYVLLYAGILLFFCIIFLGLEIVGKKVLEKGNDGDNRSKKKKAVCLILRGVCLVFLCIVMTLYVPSFFERQTELSMIDQLDLVHSDTNRYVLYRFLKNDSYLDISVENVEESYHFFLSNETPREETAAVRPDVIVIMNESWWDMDHIDTDKVSFSRDPMEKYKELQNKCVTGFATTNVYGGGTVSPETEFLTGLNTKYYVSESGIYTLLANRSVPSIVDYFQALDYKTVAIHPYYGYCYCRDKVYANMGFDKVIFAEDMTYRDIYTRYISDESLARQIREEYEHAGPGNRFIWALSIANHTRILEYETPARDDYDYPIEVKVQENLLSLEEENNLRSFVNGIYLAGEMFEELIDYFEKSDRPVILVMFGDHIPSFGPEICNALGLDTEDTSLEMLRRMYSVPVICWSNCVQEGQLEFSGESTCYLSEMLITYAGLPDCDMTRILRDQRRAFKTNSRNFVLDGEGNVVVNCDAEQIQMIRHIKAVDYDLKFGEQIRTDIWLP